MGYVPDLVGDYQCYCSRHHVRMKFLLYRDKKKEWRWKLKNKGRIIADSAEGYKRKGHCLSMVSNIIMNTQDAEIEYE